MGTGTRPVPPLEPSPVPGATLVDQMAWIRSNAMPDTHHLVEISRSYVVSSLPMPISNNVTVVLRSVNGPHTISLPPDTPGHMFLVPNTVTIVLDSGITLEGSDTDPALVGAALVGVTGTFIMNGGEISDNTGDANGGGVYVRSGGTFIMHDGTISRNTSGGPGGGVHIASGGTFYMHGGTISSNTSGTGGGVHNSGTFRMSNGVITGNTGGELQHNGTLAQRGTFTNGAFSPLGDLVTTSAPLIVVNGVLQP